LDDAASSQMSFWDVTHEGGRFWTYLGLCSGTARMDVTTMRKLSTMIVLVVRSRTVYLTWLTFHSFNICLQVRPSFSFRP
jgi:hypothetical protein